MRGEGVWEDEGVGAEFGGPDGVDGLEIGEIIFRVDGADGGGEIFDFGVLIFDWRDGDEFMGGC